MWTITPTPDGAPSRLNLLYGVSCSAATACTAVGAQGFGDLRPQAVGRRTLAERYAG